VPFGSLTEEFLIPRGILFKQGKSGEGKVVDGKTFNFYYLLLQHKKLHNQVGLDENIYSTK